MVTNIQRLNFISSTDKEKSCEYGISVVVVIVNSAIFLLTKLLGGPTKVKPTYIFVSKI